MKVAIVYDRVNKWGGAERVLLTLHEIFPEAPLFTSVYSADDAYWAKVFPRIVPSFLQKIPLSKKNHEFFAALMPIVFEAHDFSDFDLVISVTSEAAKGINTGIYTKHICYLLTPTRYLWSGYKNYFKNKFVKIITGPIISYLRKWDKMASFRPDILVAISGEVKKRVKKYYGRDSVVIYPPVEKLKDDHKFKPIVKNYYLVVSRLVKYKKVDLVIEVFNKLGLPLVIVGTGREEKKLKKIAKKNIVFVGHVTDEELSGYYKNARALIFPQEEDFGIVAVEAQSFGVPVIAYAKGGSLETVSLKTGVFFKKQDEVSLIRAIHEFEKRNFNKIVIRENAVQYSKDRFKVEFLELVKSLW